MTESLKEYEYLIYPLALILALICFAVLRIIQAWFIKNASIRAQQTATPWDDIVIELVASIKKYFIFFSSIYFVFIFLKLSPRVRLIVDKGFILLLLLQVGQISSLFIHLWITKNLRARGQQDLEVASTIGLVSFAIKTLVFSLLFLLALNNLGIDVTALIAGLSVGGIAVAFALQNILGDLFSSLTIILDKPFIVGDFIVIGDFMGTVEHIGLKATRLRSLSGEQLIFGNGDLLQSRIRNYKRMNERRVVQNLTVTYQTGADELEAIPTWIKSIVTSIDLTRFDRCHFLRFQDSSLEFELVYWILSPDFNAYADRAQKINLMIFRKFGQEGIDFAYPTRTLFIEQPKPVATT